jgi:hypothetical protein
VLKTRGGRVEEEEKGVCMLKVMREKQKQKPQAHSNFKPRELRTGHSKRKFKCERIFLRPICRGICTVTPASQFNPARD